MDKAKSVQILLIKHPISSYITGLYSFLCDLPNIILMQSKPQSLIV